MASLHTTLPISDVVEIPLSLFGAEIHLYKALENNVICRKNFTVYESWKLKAESWN